MVGMRLDGMGSDWAATAGGRVYPDEFEDIDELQDGMDYD
jgi:hypothetical protein